MSKFWTFTKTPFNIVMAPLFLDETDLYTVGKEKGNGIKEKEKRHIPTNTIQTTS